MTRPITYIRERYCINVINMNFGFKGKFKISSLGTTRPLLCMYIHRILNMLSYKQYGNHSIYNSHFSHKGLNASKYRMILCTCMNSILLYVYRIQEELLYTIYVSEYLHLITQSETFWAIKRLEILSKLVIFKSFHF